MKNSIFAKRTQIARRQGLSQQQAQNLSFAKLVRMGNSLAS